MSPYGDQEYMRPYSELKNPPAIAPNPFAAAAEKVRQSYCSAYRWNQVNNPISPQNLDLPDLLQPLTDMLCDFPGDPPRAEPKPPFSPTPGNQCACEVYDVTWSFAAPPTLPTETVTYQRRGPVSIYRDTIPLPGGRFRTEVGLRSRGLPGEPCVTERKDLGVVSEASSVTASIVRVQPRATGFTPCKRPAFPSYPEPERLPPALPPIELPDLPPFPPISIPIFVTPVIVRPEINFSPTINIDVGGVNFSFGLDGWEISFNIGGQGDIILPPNQSPTLPPLPPTPPIYLPYPVNPPPSGGGGRDCCDEILAAISDLRGRIISLKELTDLIKEKVDATDIYLRGPLKNLLDDIKECACPPEIEVATSWTDVQDFNFNAGGQELLFAIVGLTTPPIASKTYKTPNGVRVAHSGWFAFGRNNVWGAREPFDYVSKLCVAPDREFDSFTISAYTGMKHSGTLFRRKN